MGRQELATKLETIVLDRIAHNRLVLPVVPDVATRCMTILKEPEFPQRKLVQQIEADPLFAAQIMRSALSAIHGGGGAIRGVDQAVTRLGQQKLKVLVVEYMAHQLFRSSDPRIEAAAKKVWDHSIAVAMLARDIVALTGGVDGDADVAYLAGLLHDVGKPVVAAMLLEVERQADKSRSSVSWLTDGVWQSTIDAMHRKVGVAIAKEWRLPDEVAAAIRDCSDYDAATRNGVANVVRFANALAKREGFAAGTFDAGEADALIMVGRSMIGADDELIVRLAAGLSERVAARP